MIRCFLSASFSLLILAAHAPGQSVLLLESPRVGECSRNQINLTLVGQMTVTQEGSRQAIKLESTAKHRFLERTLTVSDGLASASAHYYEEASATATVGGERNNRTLRQERKLILSRRTPERPLCFSPSGTLTRDELDLITEHFDTHCIPGLLPGGEVALNATWNVSNSVAQDAGLLDGLSRNTLTGKLTDIKDGVASFSVEGIIAGLEQGARVSMIVSAVGKFDIAAKRVLELVWKQKDEREQGPISPASQLEATIAFQREAVAAIPKELEDSAILVAANAEPAPQLLMLSYLDHLDRYRMTYPRSWHITGQSDSHLILRLIDKGEFIAQATISGWQKVEPGKHSTVQEFRKSIDDSPGWASINVLQEGQIPLESGKWLYRRLAEGRIEGVPVVQSCYFLANSHGEQVVATFTMKPDKVKIVGERDLQMVRGIEPGQGK